MVADSDNELSIGWRFESWTVLRGGRNLDESEDHLKRLSVGAGMGCVLRPEALANGLGAERE